jgi:hypothetical protein
MKKKTVTKFRDNVSLKYKERVRAESLSKVEGVVA